MPSKIRDVVKVTRLQEVDSLIVTFLTFNSEFRVAELNLKESLLPINI